MITFFTCPKPFVHPHISVIQRNAIRSWTLLKGQPEVILIGNDAGVDKIASEFGLRHIPDVRSSVKGTPYLDSVFREAEAAARHDLLCYINADIILFDDFLEAVRQGMSPERTAVMVGTRTDLDVTAPLDFRDSGWDSTLKARA